MVASICFACIARRRTSTVQLYNEEKDMKPSLNPPHLSRKPLCAAILGGIVAVTVPTFVSADSVANPWAASKTFPQGQTLLLAQCKVCNPCNPCAVKKAACGACNPCAVKKAACGACNPCAIKKAACNPCNPCAVKKNPCNPCNPCKTT